MHDQRVRVGIICTSPNCHTWYLYARVKMSRHRMSCTSNKNKYPRCRPWFPIAALSTAQYVPKYRHRSSCGTPTHQYVYLYLCTILQPMGTSRQFLLRVRACGDDRCRDAAARTATLRTDGLPTRAGQAFGSCWHVSIADMTCAWRRGIYGSWTGRLKSFSPQTQANTQYYLLDWKPGTRPRTGQAMQSRAGCLH
jgi:hypothetical protein